MFVYRPFGVCETYNYVYMYICICECTGQYVFVLKYECIYACNINIYIYV